MADLQNLPMDDVVDSITLVKRHSQKKDRDYHILQIKLSNGVEIENFVDRVHLSIIQMLLKQESK